MPERLGLDQNCPARVPAALAVLCALAWSAFAAAPAVQAQEVVAGRPPMYARAERVRVYLSPLTAVRMRLNHDGDEDFAEHEIDGAGLSLGADAVVNRHVALWIAGHAGTVVGARARSDGETAGLAGAEGSFGALGAGAAGLLSTGKWSGMLGIGLLVAGAEWEGRHRETQKDVDQRATLAGVVTMLRADYTLRNGFFIGLGLDAGGGIVSGGAGETAGDWIALYLPMGWTY